MRVRTFRRLLILSVLLPLIGVFIDMGSQDQLPGALADYAAAQSATLPTTWGMVACLIILAAWVLGLIGAYRLKKLGRRLFVAAFGAGFAMVPAFGPYVVSGWALLFYHASLLLDGVLVALMYWSLLAEHFNDDR